MNLHRKLVVAVAGITAFGLVALATIALGSTGSGNTITILGHRATLSGSVHTNNDRIKFQTKDSTDFLVQTITFQPHGNSGWHYHPGVVMVIVESGHITAHDENCQTRTYGPHEVFVESGTAPFLASNESATENAVVYATIVVPAGSPFRIETDPPPCA